MSATEPETPTPTTGDPTGEPGIEGPPGEVEENDETVEPTEADDEADDDEEA